MITQYYVPGQPQNDGNRGGGYGILIIAALALAVIGVAFYHSKSDYKIVMPPIAKDDDNNKIAKK